jgi:thioredoxin 1
MRQILSSLLVKSSHAIVLTVGLLMIAGCDSSSSSPAGSTADSNGLPGSSQARKPIHIEPEDWKKEVLESKELVLVDFWAPWCGPCKLMDPVLESLVKEYKVCKVNVDDNHELAAKFNVNSIPRLMIFKDGNKVFEAIGVTSENELRAELKKHARREG